MNVSCNYSTVISFICTLRKKILRTATAESTHTHTHAHKINKRTARLLNWLVSFEGTPE